MKVWAAAALLLGLSACAAPPRPATRVEPSPEAKASVDRLRVEKEYRPAPQGADVVSVFYELPAGAYIAQGWAYECWPVYLRRPWCRESSFQCAPISYGLYRPYYRRRFCD